MCEMCRNDSRRLLEPSRRSFILAASAAGLLLANGAVAKETKAPPKPQNVLSPDAALKRLKEGNERYVAGVAKRHDFKHEREALAGGQNPYAAILSCAEFRRSRRQRLYTFPPSVRVALLLSASTRVVGFQLTVPQPVHESPPLVSARALPMRALSFWVAAEPWSTGSRLNGCVAGCVA